MNIQLPKRPKSHIICDEGVKIFMSHCPSSWVINEVKIDYGIDFRIEISQGEVVTGEEFSVQVKSHNSIKISSSNKAIERIEPTTINYWIRKLQPILIVSVDISKNIFWFDWFHKSYTDYPNPCKGLKPISLKLDKNSASCNFQTEILAFVHDFYDRIRSDISTLFNRTQLTRILFHVSELYRYCVDMIFTLQSYSNKDKDKLGYIIFWFFVAFALHDDFLITLWEDYKEMEKDFSPIVRCTIGDKLKEYIKRRSKFYFKEKRISAGDFNITPIRLSKIHEDLFPIIGILSELQQFLLQLLVLGKLVMSVENKTKKS
jgi:hypothetical protein